MVALRTTVVSLFLFVGACGVGEVPLPGGGMVDAGGGGDPGAAAFVKDVKPLLTRCDGCHAGGQPPNLMSFDTLAASYRVKPGVSAKLVVEEPDGGLHNGVPYFSALEKSAIIKWIDSLP
jgi:hypothetical protein